MAYVKNKEDFVHVVFTKSLQTKQRNYLWFLMGSREVSTGCLRDFDPPGS